MNEILKEIDSGLAAYESLKRSKQANSEELTVSLVHAQAKLANIRKVVEDQKSGECSIVQVDTSKMAYELAENVFDTIHIIKRDGQKEGFTVFSELKKILDQHLKC